MSKRVLVLNAGSSSLKYQLVDAEDGTALASGLVERIGESESTATHHVDDQKYTHTGALADHEAAIAQLTELFDEHGPSLAEADIVAVGHRVVQGGSRFSAPTLIDDDVVAAVEELVPLAPLHNPGCLSGISAARRLFPDLPHVAVFDTAFHQTLPDYAYTYAVPTKWTAELGVRRYGFHGTSHSYVSREAAGMLGKDPSQVKVIVAHLGNGASITAVRGGQSVDTSMGLTPLQGLMMGTRSGDVDPAVVSHVSRELDISATEVDNALNKQSGLLGMTGVNDMREVAKRANAGDAAAILARAVYVYRIKWYVGAYLAVLGGADAIAFTAGVGENDAWVRANALSDLEALGIVIDDAANESGSGERFISTEGSPVAVMVIPTNEELEIAQQSVAAIEHASH